MVVVLVAEPCATHSQDKLSLCAWALTDTPSRRRSSSRLPADRLSGRRGSLLRNTFGRFPALRTHFLIVANSSPDSVLEAFRRKSDGRSPAPLASPPGAAPLARSCGSSRTEQDCSRNDQRNNSRVKLTCLATV